MNERRAIDLNADLGEMPEALQRDKEILSLVSSANIACGGHAGDEQSMRFMIRHAKAHDVRIGAHPSYPDKENFGRQSMEIKPEDLAQSLRKQIVELMRIADEESANICYLKPHGALYNEAMDDEELSDTLIKVVRDIDPRLAIMGMAQSALEQAAMRAGLQYISEAFIDRRYTANARLQRRTIDGAIITNFDLQWQQALSLASGNAIMAEGEKLYIAAQSLCMHSDSDGALDNIKKLRNMLLKHNIMIKANNA